jgi:hypothetical protein
MTLNMELTPLYPRSGGAFVNQPRSLTNLFTLCYNASVLLDYCYAKLFYRAVRFRVYIYRAHDGALGGHFRLNQQQYIKLTGL